MAMQSLARSIASRALLRSHKNKTCTLPMCGPSTTASCPERADGPRRESLGIDSPAAEETHALSLVAPVVSVVRPAGVRTQVGNCYRSCACKHTQADAQQRARKRTPQQPWGSSRPLDRPTRQPTGPARRALWRGLGGGGGVPVPAV